MAYAHRQFQVPPVCSHSAITYTNSDSDSNGYGCTYTYTYANRNARWNTQPDRHPDCDRNGIANSSSSLSKFSDGRRD